MRLRSKVRELITALLDNTHKWRKLVVAFSCIVVFVTTYLLILPAFTLDKEEAAEQGGIDVPAVSQEAGEENTAEAGAPAEDDTKEDSAKEPERDPLTYEGDGYSVTVDDTSSVLPDDTSVSVEEITSETDAEQFDELYRQAEAAIADEADKAGNKTTIDFVRFYDISLAADGTEIEPERSVSVIIEYEKKLSRELSVDDPQNVRIVHYKKDPETGKNETELLDSDEIGLAVETENDRMSAASFEAESFSVYGIVKTSEEPVKYVDTASDLSELTSTEAESGFYLSVSNGTSYFTSNVIGGDKGVLTETTDKTQGAIWFFEPVEGTDNQFRIYTIVDDAKKYIKQVTAGKNQITLAETGDAFEISLAPEGKFYFKLASEKLWLQHSGSGGGIRLYTDANNAGNSRITLTFASHVDPGDDPYGLGGNSYGIAYNDEAITAAALTDKAVTVSGQQRLAGEDLLIREDVLEHKGVLLVSSESDITEWTFENIEEDKYYIRTGTDDSPKYLTINGNIVTLQAEPDPAKSLIQAIPGTGDNAGKWKFSSNGRMLMFDNSADRGFGSTNNANAKVWFNLLEKSDKLDNDDFVPYTARKVSVSDNTQVYDKTDENTGERKQSQVIIYTRIWNEETKRYDTYAVDHDGTLFKVYPSGDLIQWVGSDAKSAIWEFTEYHEEDGTTPNYYYELKNAGYGNYISPRLTGGQITSDEAPGINLPGRRNGLDYSTIVAWDDEHYEFAGLKVGEDGKVVPCPLEEAATFHFAILTETDEPAEELTTVDTIDNKDFGIKMKMIDFNNDKVDDRDSRQTQFFGKDTDGKELLSSQLGEDGYPVVNNVNTSLADLFARNDPDNPVLEANKLFIKSIHDESGYFEYDSTQNFAHFETEGDKRGEFTVYDQLAQIGSSTWPTRTHGQFMPYNNIVPGRVSPNITNQTDVTGEPLPDTDPRKGEKLYHITDGEADYFFGMEMEASFTQTADGLDDWGHDIIFEFSGDDDFWLYVDGELVLDLGGVHSASSGSINFRTGEVTMVRRKYVNNKMQVATESTTLREVFRGNYEKRGLSEDQIAEKLDEIFEQKIVDGEERYVFKDFSSHTMKMFYMERGAGASNLHMRFNLASVKPGTALLSKKVSGVESQSNSLTEYPFQIRYLVQEFNEDGTEKIDPETDKPLTTEYVLANEKGEVKAYYAGTTKEVPFRSTFTTSTMVDDTEYKTEYNNVYLLKAGETAELVFPEHTTHYAVVECGVDPDVYKAVKVGDNEEVVSGKIRPVDSSETAIHNDPVDETGTYYPVTKKDYGIGYAELNKRPEAAFDNQLNPDAVSSLEITKKLYDTNGKTKLHYDPKEGDAEDSEDKSVFNFRLYLGSEYDDANKLPAANMYLYHVRNRDGEYCKWSAIGQKFESLGPGKDNFSALDDEEKKAATFRTSIYGAISRIPSDYTVEVPDLVANTKFKVEERTNEIPRGYTLRSGDGYQRTDNGHEENYETTPVSGVIKKIKDTETDTTKIDKPKVLISNQKGWGLSAEKVWTDKDFVESRDDIFLAVYVKTREEGDANPYTLYPETVRRLKSKETEVYYFFDDLYFEGKTRNFEDFVVREVKVEVTEDSDKTLEELIDKEGHVMISETVGEGDAAEVKTYAEVTPIAQDEPVIVPGVKKGDTEKTDLEYTVLYKQGEPTGRNENVRVDKVINSRPGIILYKTDWTGQWKVDDGTGTVTGALSGAGFSITDEDGRNIAAETYMSGDDGLVTVVYLDEGEYTLTETKSPKGYVGLEKLVTVSVDENNRVTVSGSAAGTYCTTHNPEGSETYVTDETYGKMYAAVTVRNRRASLTAKKVDSSNAAVSGAHFALYRQINTSGGGVRKDFYPIEGYEDIVSEQDGIIPGIDMDLRAGTYYLQEIEAPEGYELLKSDLKFTIGSNGVVTIDEAVNGSSIMSSTDDESGDKTWTIRIPNGKTAKVSFRKIDIVQADGHDVPLGGAEFDLYTTEGGETGEKIYEGLTSRDEDGLLTYGTDGEITVFELGDGVYQLVETNAPEGYIKKESPVIITISNDGTTVRYDEGTSLSNDGEGESYDGDSGVHTLSITNTAGIELPHTGGPGTAMFYILGSLLTLGSAVMLAARRRLKGKN